MTQTHCSLLSILPLENLVLCYVFGPYFPCLYHGLYFCVGNVSFMLFLTSERFSGLIVSSILLHKNTEKENEKVEAQMTETTSSETDISVVLNAWYSAGFYTGKYVIISLLIMISFK